MKKFILTSILILISLFSFSQVTNNFEDGSWIYYYNRCWGIGPNSTYFGTKVNSAQNQSFNQSSVCETDNLGQVNRCILESPWINLSPGNITFNHCIPSFNGTRTLKVYIFKKMENNNTEHIHLLWSYEYLDNLQKIAIIPNSYTGNWKIRWEWEGSGGNSRGQIDNILIPGINISDPSNNCEPYTPIIIDTIYNYYPAINTSTLAFEDLWPSYGDYDMNDLVIGYKFKITSYDSYVVSVDGTFIVKADGAGLSNGFGFQFPILPSNILSVDGNGNQNGYDMASNGTELGNINKATFIVFSNQHDFMSEWNTVKGENVCPEYTFNIHIKFKQNSITLQQLSIQTWNPFMVKNGIRGQEIHLPNYEPTQLANYSLFGTGDDDTQIGVKYYKSKNNLPWALDITGNFEYPIEKNDISTAYLHFQDWILSSGENYKDWWSNISNGYRNPNFIY